MVISGAADSAAAMALAVAEFTVVVVVVVRTILKTVQQWHTLAESVNLEVVAAMPEYLPAPMTERRQAVVVVDLLGQARRQAMEPMA
jgi:hypothetical protein